jgi:16S rRNA processing protein RimM
MNQAPPLEELLEELMPVGRLVAAQGLRGELRLLPLSDFPERFTRPGPRWLEGRRAEPPQQVELLSGRQLPGKELFVVRLGGIDDRDGAEALVGRHLLVPAGDRPALQPGEFHLLDLMGLEVRLLPQGLRLGHVTDLIHAGNDLLEIELDGDRDGGGNGDGDGPARRLLIPFVEPIVPEVHIAAGWVGLTPPPGLLDL